MSDPSMPPTAPYQGPYPVPQTSLQGPDPRKVLAVFVLVLAVIAIVALVLANSGFGSGGGNTPAGTLEDYAAGLNDGDARAMFDQTVLSLSPDYESQLVWLQQTILAGGPHIEISNITVIDKEDLSQLQEWEANDTIDEVYDELGKTVDDYCLLTYSVVLTYEGFPPTAFDSEVLCVLIDGTWYLAIWGLV